MAGGYKGRAISMATSALLSEEQVRQGLLSSLFADQFVLAGMHLETNPLLPDLDLEFDAECQEPVIVLVVGSREGEKRIRFDIALPVHFVPEDSIGIEGAKVPFRDFVLAFMKPKVRIGIERDSRRTDWAGITLSFADFETYAICPLSHLACFVCDRPEHAAPLDAFFMSNMTCH